MFFKFHEEMREIFYKDIDKFNILSWITFNTNYQEEYEGLKKYECYISIRSITEYTKINHAKVQRVLKTLDSEGFISYKFKSKSKHTASIIYADFIAKNDAKSDTVNDTVSDTVNEPVVSIANTEIQDIRDTVNDTVSDTVSDTLSRNISRNISNICASNDRAFNEIWSLYPNKKGKANAYKKVDKLLKKYTLEELKRCVKRYSKEVEGKDKQYIKYGDTFFNAGYVDYLDENYIDQSTAKEETKRYDIL